MSNWFRQLGGRTSNWGRQLGRDVSQFGRQLHSGLKLMPSAFKDTSKVYSDLERRTKGLPLVPNVFHGASLGTQAIGDLLSGNYGKAYSGGREAIKSGADTLQKGEPLATMFA